MICNFIFPEGFHFFSFLLGVIIFGVLGYLIGVLWCTHQLKRIAKEGFGITDFENLRDLENKIKGRK